MKIKVLPATVGFGLVWDRFASSVYLTIIYGTVVFHFPRVGKCRHCSHGPHLHKASRERGIVVWSCSGHDGKRLCDCDHYSPESK